MIAGFAFALARATVAIGRISVVARFVAGDDAIATNASITHRCRRAIGHDTLIPSFDFARTRTPIVIGRISIVARLAKFGFDFAIATRLRAYTLARVVGLCTIPSRFAVAICRATIARISVAVVARFAEIGLDFAIATSYFRANRFAIAALAAVPSDFDLALARATVAVFVVSVVAHLIAVHGAIAAIIHAFAIDSTNVVFGRIARFIILPIVALFSAVAVDFIEQTIATIMRSLTSLTTFSEPVIIVKYAVVARLAFFDFAIATAFVYAIVARRWARIPFFDRLTIGRATIARNRISIVARLAFFDFAIAANRRHALTVVAQLRGAIGRTTAGVAQFAWVNFRGIAYFISALFRIAIVVFFAHRPDAAIADDLWRLCATRSIGTHARGTLRIGTTRRTIGEFFADVIFDLTDARHTFPRRAFGIVYTRRSHVFGLRSRHRRVVATACYCKSTRYEYRPPPSPFHFVLL